MSREHLINPEKQFLPKEQFCSFIRSAIFNGGYKAVTSYCSPLVVKTNAPIEFIRKMVIAWHNASDLSVDKGDISFEDNAEAKKILRNATPRFMPNPEKNWGPKSAAKIKQEKYIETNEESSKKIKN